MRHAEVTQANGNRVHALESIVIRVPAHRDYIVVVRSAVAQLGAHLGYTVSEVTDLRLAVDEACCLLVAGRPLNGPTAGDLECRVEVGTWALEVTVAASAAEAVAPDKDSFGWNVLTALVDSLSWAHDDATAWIKLMKRHGIRGG